LFRRRRPVLVDPGGQTCRECFPESASNEDRRESSNYYCARFRSEPLPRSCCPLARADTRGCSTRPLPECRTTMEFAPETFALKTQAPLQLLIGLPEVLRRSAYRTTALFPRAPSLLPPPDQSAFSGYNREADFLWRDF